MHRAASARLLPLPPTPDSVILAFELFRNFILCAETEALCDQAANCVPAAQRSHPSVGFGECDRHTTGNERLQKVRGLAGTEVIHSTSERRHEVKRLGPSA